MIHAQAPGNMSIEQKFPVSIEVQLLGAKRMRIVPQETYVLLARMLVLEAA